MGHYASEMGTPYVQPEYAVESMDFYQPYRPPFYDAGVQLWVHRPCSQVFYVNDKHVIDDSLLRHCARCPEED